MRVLPFLQRPGQLCAAISLLAVSGMIGSPADEALKQMKVADGFEVTLVACEPEIRQPLSITFDDRGRMWVIQYLQYPTPAGLKPVKVDQYLRTTYDKVPEPPPRGPKGIDRITICEDTNGDGRMDKFKDFVKDLNLCTGMALGYGGVFVVQPPYLLFYPDKNRDDVPDADPEVLLTGFGMEDAHACANSLTWGPDGWLYGAQGSTVTANILGTEFQQGIWRYHPVTRFFELFAEGGGNTWGMDFDEEGEILAGTNFNEKMLHYVQGAYYVKNFGKHGALHNPHTYGYFEHVPYSGYAGKHISIGGIVYQGGAFPAQFRGKYIFGNTLDHAVYWADVKRNGSTFTSSFGGTLLKTDDELFRPVDCTTGPDGAIYVADWCDKRATHVDPLDTWDRSNGRIYRIQSKQAPAPRASFDLSKLSSDRLVELLADSNDWFSRQARQLLAQRQDKATHKQLREQVFNSANHRLQVQSLWTLDCSGGLTDKLRGELLSHTNETIRKWTVRSLGDQGTVGLYGARLEELAETEPSATVRAQMACSARRWPLKESRWILSELLERAEDAADPFIPLLLWWAIEDKAISERRGVAKMFVHGGFSRSALVRQHILECLGRRYAAEGGFADYAACADILDPLTDPRSGAYLGEDKRIQAELFLKGIDKALAGKTLETVPQPLSRWFAQKWKLHKRDPLFVRLGLRFNWPEANEIATKLMLDEKESDTQRVELIEILAQSGRPELVPLLLQLVEHSPVRSVKLSALSNLRRFSDATVATKIIELFPKFEAELRQQAKTVLTSRTTFAAALVAAVEGKRIDAKEVSLEQVRAMAAFQDEPLNRRLEKIWGRIQPDSPAELQNTVNRMKLVLKPSGVAGREPKGNLDEGKKLFQQSCAVCHKLYGEGGTIGPDLTTTDRKDTGLLLMNIVNPSGYIRTEFMAHEVETSDDQTVSGLIAEATANAVTIIDRNNQRLTIPRSQIKELRESTTSLMPEGLLEPLSPQQLIDLFSYLQRD